MKNQRLKIITSVALISALSFITVFLIRVPVISFLSYEPKDVIITIGGLIFGPFVSLVVSLIVSLVEMVTISSTGAWGMLMNFLSTAAFACVASFIYKKKKDKYGAYIGLFCGIVSMTSVMLLWNYIVTPYYMGYPREAVAAMLVPVFLPFNLFKASLNAAFTLLLYKPVVTALRRAKIISDCESAKSNGKRHSVLNPLTLIAALFLLISATLILLVLRGII